MYENLIVKLNALCNSCANMACCSSEFVFTFLYLGNRIQNASEKFVCFIRLYFVDFALHEQKFSGVKCGGSNSYNSLTFQK